MAVLIPTRFVNAHHIQLGVYTTSPVRRWPIKRKDRSLMALIEAAGKVKKP